jgi:hypothetical protein
VRRLGCTGAHAPPPLRPGVAVALQEVMDLVREKGMFSFYEDGHGECCRIRKVPAAAA